MSKASIYSLGMFVTAAFSVELLALAMLIVSTPLVAYGHGVGFFYEISLIACFVSPLLVGLALYCSPRSFWIGLGIFEIVAAYFVMGEINTQGWNWFRDFCARAPSSIVLWGVLFNALHVVFVALTRVDR